MIILQKPYIIPYLEFRFCFLTEKTSINQIRNKMIQFTGQYVGMLESGEQAIVKRYIKSFENGGFSRTLRN